MDSTIETVRGYYDEHAQLEWDRLKERPFEFIFTTEMMERYVRPGDRILDIGGGPGRYSIHFAKMGCQVVLAELSSGNVVLAREKAAEAGVAIETHVCDCLALDQLGLGGVEGGPGGNLQHPLQLLPRHRLLRPRQRALPLRVQGGHGPARPQPQLLRPGHVPRGQALRRPPQPGGQQGRRLTVPLRRALFPHGFHFLCTVCPHPMRARPGL